MLIANMGEDEETFKAYVTASMQDYIRQYREACAKESDVECLEGFYAHMEYLYSLIPASRKGEIKCIKGCSFCCYINVSVTELEAKLLVKTWLAKGRTFNIKQLKRQAPLSDSERPRSKCAACPFLLRDGTCGVYEARPTHCRKYWVVDTRAPKQCEVGKKLKDVHVFADPDTEIIASTILNIGHKSGSMAKMLLQELDNIKASRMAESICNVKI